MDIVTGCVIVPALMMVSVIRFISITSVADLVAVVSGSMMPMISIFFVVVPVYFFPVTLMGARCMVFDHGHMLFFDRGSSAAFFSAVRPGCTAKYE